MAVALASLAAGATPLAAAAPADSARLLAARITIRLAGDTVHVEAGYRLGGREGAAGAEAEVLSARRFEGQALQLAGGADEAGGTGSADGADAADAGLEALPGLWRLRMPAGGAAGPGGSAAPGGPERDARLRIRYRLIGRPDRVPLFVPATPPPPAGMDVEIRVLEARGGGKDRVGGEAAVDPRAAFPRLSRAPDGVLVARPTQLPGFVHLPRVGGGPGVDRTADAAVALLVALGLGSWAAVRRRVRDRGRGPADQEDPGRASPDA